MEWANLALAAVLVYGIGMASGIWLTAYHWRNGGTLRRNRIKYDNDPYGIGDPP